MFGKNFDFLPNFPKFTSGFFVRLKTGLKRYKYWDLAYCKCQLWFAGQARRAWQTQLAFTLAKSQYFYLFNPVFNLTKKSW
jgi:hypothetical protein